MDAFSLHSFLFAIYLTETLSSSQIAIPTSCNDQSIDGVYYIKPTASGNVIPVICSNGYTMLDLSLNEHAIRSYFTSFYQYGDEFRTIYGTDCGESSAWKDWYIPADSDTQFRVADQCTECIDGEQHGSSTAYYMTGRYICPTATDNGGCGSTSFNTSKLSDQMCNICDDTSALCGAVDGIESEYTGAWCDCYSLQFPADLETTTDSDQYCKTGYLTWRPSVVTDRSQCTCYKPAVYEDIPTEYIVSTTDLPLVSVQYKEELLAAGWYIDDNIQWQPQEEYQSKSCDDNIIYLNTEDFISGTYRITECGRYHLTEDIEVNFNAPSQPMDYTAGDSPNSYNRDNLHWFPTTEQQESGQYPGLDQFYGPYTLGFFAAITVETDNVVIDLNGFTLGMNREFYLQQRFFALIELGSAQFEAKQGPVDFGRNVVRGFGVKIRNGHLGLTSHHGIHGKANDLIIEDLTISNFDVTGIQCNGCNEVIIRNVDIGGQNADIPVLGRYVHGRVMLSRLRYMVDEYGDETLQFANRDEEVTLRSLADRLVEQLGCIPSCFPAILEFRIFDIFYVVFMTFCRCKGSIWCTFTYFMEWNSMKRTHSG